MPKCLSGLFSLMIFMDCQADQFEIANIDEANVIFWQKLYPEGGWTLYCGDKFDASHERAQIHAVYAIDWVKEHLACGAGPAECRANSARFNRIEADLHNLYPVLAMTGNARKDYSFGQIDGEFRDFFECNFEVDGGKKIVEARQTALGNIARAFFYMLDEYQLPPQKQQLKLLLQWNKEDPPSKDEIRRNDLIEALQGTRNSFIDDPGRADKLFQ